VLTATSASEMGHRGPAHSSQYSASSGAGSSVRGFAAHTTSSTQQRGHWIITPCWISLAKGISAAHSGQGSLLHTLFLLSGRGIPLPKRIARVPFGLERRQPSLLNERPTLIQTQRLACSRPSSWIHLLRFSQLSFASLPLCYPLVRIPNLSSLFSLPEKEKRPSVSWV